MRIELDSAESAHNKLRDQHGIARDMFELKVEYSSALPQIFSTPDMTLEDVLPTPMMNGDPKGEVPLTFMEHYLFIDLNMKWMTTIVLHRNSVVVAVVRLNIYETYVGPYSTFSSFLFDVYLAPQYINLLFSPAVFLLEPKNQVCSVL